MEIESLAVHRIAAIDPETLMKSNPEYYGPRFAALAEERAVLGVKQELWRGLLRELQHHHAALTFRERYDERTQSPYTARSVS